MIVFAALDVAGTVSLAAILLLCACVVAAIVGTRIVRRKQKQEVRRWRLERKPEHKEND